MRKKYYEDYLKELLKTIAFEFKRGRRHSIYALTSKRMARIISILNFYNIDLRLIDRLRVSDEIRQFPKLENIVRLVLGIKKVKADDY